MPWCVCVSHKVLACLFVCLFQTLFADSLMQKTLIHTFSFTMINHHNGQWAFNKLIIDQSGWANKKTAHELISMYVSCLLMLSGMAHMCLWKPAGLPYTCAWQSFMVPRAHTGNHRSLSMNRLPHSASVQ